MSASDPKRTYRVCEGLWISRSEPIRNHWPQHEFDNLLFTLCGRRLLN